MSDLYLFSNIVSNKKLFSNYFIGSFYLLNYILKRRYIKKLEEFKTRQPKFLHLKNKFLHLKNLDYLNRCIELNFKKLEIGRIRGDLILKFKMENKIDEIDWEFELKALPLRGRHHGCFQR